MTVAGRDVFGAACSGSLSNAVLDPVFPAERGKAEQCTASRREDRCNPGVQEQGETGSSA
jgi:hypothetical protein